MSQTLATRGGGAGAPGRNGTIPLPSNERFYKITYNLAAGQEVTFDVGNARVFYMDQGPTLADLGDVEFAFNDCFPFITAMRAMYLRLPFSVTRMRIRNNNLGAAKTGSFIVSSNPELLIIQGFT